MGPNFSVSTPYDFANLIDSHPSNLVVKNAVNHLIDFTITIFEARCYSA